MGSSPAWIVDGTNGRTFESYPYFRVEQRILGSGFPAENILAVGSKQFRDADCL